MSGSDELTALYFQEAVKITECYFLRWSTIQLDSVIDVLLERFCTSGGYKEPNGHSKREDRQVKRLVPSRGEGA